MLDGSAGDNQKALAKSELESKKNEINTKIDSLTQLSEDEKNSSKGEAGKALDKAIDNVKNALSAEDIAAFKELAISDLEDVAENAEAKNLENAKASAASEISSSKDGIAAAIDELSYLDDAQKEALLSSLETIISEGKENIASAENTDSVASAKSAALDKLSAKNSEAEQMNDDACIDRLTPVMLTLGIIGSVELIAIAVLLATRKKTSLASFVPLGMLTPVALKLQPAAAWSLTGALAIADILMALFIVYLIVQRVKAKPVAVTEPVAEPEPIPEPESEPEPETEPEVIIPEPLESVTVDEANDMMSDEEALKHEDTGFVNTEVYKGSKKAEINIDTISRNFEAGDTVTLNTLKQKGLVSKQAGYVKVLARGTLDKPLTVIAQNFSVSAIKMIVLTGGSAIVTYGSPERQ